MEKIQHIYQFCLQNLQVKEKLSPMYFDTLNKIDGRIFQLSFTANGCEKCWSAQFTTTSTRFSVNGINSRI
jgi:hypothetical protein